MNDRTAGENSESRTRAWRFCGDRRGSMLVWAAFLMVPLLGFMGIAVDSARGYMVRARLSQALDAAALAAGRQTTDQDKAETEARMIFMANFPSGYMDADVGGPDISFNTEGDTVTVTATATIPTYFVELIGFDDFTVSASSEVTRKTVYMDVVVSIDVSASMNEYINGTKKITAASSAATTLVDVLFGTSDTKDLLKMGLVTWSANARILDIGSSYRSSNTTSKTVTSFVNPYTGSSQTKVYYASGSPVPLLSAPPSGWTGCTRARFLDDGTDNDGDLSVGPVTVGGKQWMAWDPAVQTITGYTYQSGYGYGYGYGGSWTKVPVYSDMQCNNQGIQRLTNTKATITSAMQQVKNPTGNTNMIMGLMWAWTVLGVPDSGSPFEGDGTAAPADGEGQIVRAIVLMTDGDNTQSSTDAYEGNLSNDDLDTRTLAAAQAIKDAGVIIYTIRFGSSSNSESLLKLVASGSTAPYYQYAPDADALEAAFEQVGSSLSKLRISR